MALNTYIAGENIIFLVTFTNEATGVVVDPTKIVFAYQVGVASPVSVQYPTLIEKVAVGVYQIPLDSTSWATLTTGQVTVRYVWASPASGAGGGIRASSILINPAPIAVTFT